MFRSPFPFGPPPRAWQLLPFALASSLNASGGSLTKFHRAPQPHTQSTHWSNNRRYLSRLSPSLFGPPRNRTSSSVGLVWGSTIPSRCAMHSAAIANGLGRAGATSGLPTLRSLHHISPFTQSVSGGGGQSKAGHIQISSAVMAGKLPENLARYQWNCSTVECQPVFPPLLCTSQTDSADRTYTISRCVCCCRQPTRRSIAHTPSKICG